MSKGGRPATGSIEWHRNDETGLVHWHVRITLADGSRPYEPLDPLIPHSDTEAAKAGARDVSEEARRIGAVPAARETVRHWFKRFHKFKESRGRSSVGDMRGRAAKWIFPTIGDKDMRAVTREDIEAIVRRLDVAIIVWQKHEGVRGEGRMSPSTAKNVWGDLQHAFEEAVRAKDPGLRVLTVSPCANVRGPESGNDREGPILYSDELLSLLVGKAADDEGKDVPLYRRRVYAVAHYTMARRSELAALTAGDVDFAHETISISKQVDRKKKTATKKTKTRRTRTIDIEPNLLPLVAQLAKEARTPTGRLLHMPPAEDCAELLRKDLWAVGARDDRLHTEDATRTMMVFHCLRDSGLTHMAVRGDSPIVIQWRGGHTDFKTTQGYLDRGRVEARRIGQPLPPLPPDLFTPDPSPPQRDRGGSARVLPQGKTSAPNQLESLTISRPQRELKPQPESGERACFWLRREGWGKSKRPGSRPLVTHRDPGLRQLGRGRPGAGR